MLPSAQTADHHRYTDPALELAASFLAGARTDPRQVPWHRLQREDLRVLRGWLADAVSSETARRVLLSIRRAVRQELRRSSPEEVALREADLVSVTRGGRTRPGSRGLDRRAVRSLLHACSSDRTTLGRRDAAVIALMLYAGLGRDALRGLRRADFDDSSSILKVRARGNCVGRAIILGESCSDLLRAWLAAADGSGALFCRLSRNGTAGGTLSAAAISALLARRAGDAGLGRLTPGQLRGRFRADLRERTRRGDWPLASRYEDEDGRPLLLYHALA